MRTATYRSEILSEEAPRTLHVATGRFDGRAQAGRSGKSIR